MNTLARFAAALVVLGARSATAATVLHVDAGSAPGGDGSTWATAFADLADALDVAAAGTQIWVREGTYRPDRGTGIRSMSFELPAGVAILGGFAGGESSPLERDPDAHPTVLSGDLLGDDDMGGLGDNSYHVLEALLLVAPASLDGLWIVGGNANGFLHHSRGGGLAAIESTVTFVDCRLEGNRAGSGGAISAFGGVVSLVGSSVAGNVALARGGGVDGTATLVLSTDTDWLDNAVTGPGGSIGGAIHLGGGAAAISEGLFSGNSAAMSGGSIHVATGDISLSGSVFLGESGGAGGGAINFANAAVGSLVAVGCWFEDCTGESGAGGAIQGDIAGAATISQCVFLGNSADEAGAVAVTGSSSEPVLIEGCVFEANIASDDRAGAIYLTRPGGAVVRDCAFFDNSAASKGGAMLVAGTVDVIDCHLESNVSSNGGSLYIAGTAGTVISISGCDFLYNDTFGGSGGTGGVLNNPGSPPLPAISIDDSYFEGNGIAVALSSFTGTIRRCAFVGNGAGACQLSSSDTAVVECDFIANEAGGGSAVRVMGGAPKLVRCRFLGNKATSTSSFDGGAVMLQSATPLIADCLFSGNAAANRGGAIFSRDAGTATIRHCTFAGNTCPTTGDAITVDGTAVNLGNCILWGNGGATQADQVLALAGGSIVVNSTSVQGWTGSLGGTGNNGLNPLFAAALGPDALVGTLDDDLHLLAGSPAIDSGDATLLPADVADLDADGDVAEPMPLDLDGNPRVVGVVDRGAYESRQKAPRPRTGLQPAERRGGRRLSAEPVEVPAR